MEDASTKTTDRIKASELLAERGWGKAPTFLVAVDTCPQRPTQEEQDRIAKELSRRVEQIAAAREARDGLASTA